MKQNNPSDYFDAIYCINLDRRTDQWEAVQKEFTKVGILDRVVRFSAIETPENGHIGCMLSHRAIIQKAKDEGWRNVLVFEDDIFFRYDYSYYAKLLKNLSDIKDAWYLFYFGGYISPFRWTTMSKITELISKVSYIHCTHAVVYRCELFDYFLENIPGNIKKAIVFLDKWKYFDSWLCSIQKTHLSLVCRDFSIFQNRLTSDTDGKNSIWSYFKQYLYLFFKYPILRKVFKPFVKIKHALEK